MTAHVVLDFWSRRGRERHDGDLGKVSAKVANLGVVGSGEEGQRGARSEGGERTESRDPLRDLVSSRIEKEQGRNAHSLMQ